MKTYVKIAGGIFTLLLTGTTAMVWMVYTLKLLKPVAKKDPTWANGTLILAIILSLLTGALWIYYRRYVKIEIKVKGKDLMGLPKD